MRTTKCPFLLALIGLLVAALPAHAPNSRGGRDHTIEGAVSPERVKSDMEGYARKLQESWPRANTLYFTTARNPREFAALAKYTLFLVSAWTQKEQELPVKRVFIRAPRGEEIRVLKVSTWRTQVDPQSITAKRYGPFREDGFYLVPTGPLLREGQIVMDLTAGATEWVMLELPGNVTAAERRHLRDPEQAVSSKPDLRTLQEVIRREFPGFPVPRDFQ
jgi:hypothetical protein